LTPPRPGAIRSASFLYYLSVVAPARRGYDQLSRGAPMKLLGILLVLERSYERQLAAAAGLARD
jgi:hypothetical protein